MKYDLFAKNPGANQKFSTNLIEVNPNIEGEIINILNQYRSKVRKQIKRPVKNNSINIEIGPFTADLVKSWREHNQSCDEIDLFLSENFEESGNLNYLTKLYYKIREIDQRKRYLSCHIKSAINYEFNSLSKKLIERERSLALTLSRPDFWSSYIIDHDSKNDTDLAIKYHRSSFVLLNRRRRDLCSRFKLQKSPRNISDKLKILGDSWYKNRLLKLDFLLEIDNYWEPLWVKSLIGIPDYHLRLKLVSELEKETKIKRNPFDDSEIDNDLSMVVL